MPDRPEEPKETVRDVVAEAGRGRSPRTPLVALWGVALLVGAAAAIVVMVLFLVYYVT